MPAGIILNISNITGKLATTKPHYTLFFLIFLILFFIFSERLIGLSNYASVIILLFIFALIISLIFFDAYGKYEIYNDIFNSTAGKNFFAIFLLVFFIIFVYELPMYDSDKPHDIINKLTFGHNKLISNRFVGISIIFSLSMLTAYSIYKTSRD
jgi:hypothetical protein